MAGSNLTAARIRYLVDYDPLTGVFTRKTLAGGRTPGSIAGYQDRSGYWVMTVDGRPYFCHRLAWLHVYGEWPKSFIDHINSIKSDNRLENLRSATKSENGQNLIRPNRVNKLGILGVSKHGNGFRAQLTLNGKKVFKKTFKTAELAQTAYLEAKEKFHPASTIGPETIP